MKTLWEKSLRFLRLHRIAAALLLLAAGVAIYAYWIEPDRLIVRHCTITLPKLPQELDGLRLIVASDFHFLPSQIASGRVKRIAEVINARKGDLILLCGDFANGMDNGQRMIPMPELTSFAASLKASCGVFAVPGNHDFWFGRNRIAEALRNAGVHVLENSHFVCRIRGKNLVVAGIEDRSTGQPNMVSTLRDLDPNDPVILLSHDPEMIFSMPRRASLMVAGHTHGGQLRLPLLGALYRPKFFSKYEPGLNRNNDALLYLTSGIGGFPIRARFCCVPEVAVLTLRSPMSQNVTEARQNVAKENR